MIRWLGTAVIATVIVIAALSARAQSTAADVPIEQVVRTAMFSSNELPRQEALQFLVNRGKLDVAPGANPGPTVCQR